MSFLTRLFSSSEPDSPRPILDAIFGSSRISRGFLEAVGADLAARGFAVEAMDASITAVRDEQRSTYGLQNLAQLCASAGRAKWGAAIQSHFDGVFRAEDELGAVDEQADDFDKVRHLLKVKIYPSDYPVVTEGIAFPLADGIVAAIAFDLPSSIANVKPAYLAKWQRTKDDLFAIGMANVKAEPSPKFESVVLDGGVALTALAGDSLFTASHALLLADYLPNPLPNGALVAIPNRHAVVFHAIENNRASAAVTALARVAHGMNAKGPGSLTPSIYWWRAGTFERLPAVVNDGLITFVPPQAFVEMLGRLAS